VSVDPKDAGHMQETFFPGVPGVAYNVIVLNDKYSVEYDCGTELGVTNVRGRRKEGDASDRANQSSERRPLIPSRVWAPLFFL
jgi:hypothetical protein